MMKTILNFLFVCNTLMALASCNINRENDFFTISVDAAENGSFALSEITDHVAAIELEVTNNSLIKRVKRVLYTDECIIIGMHTAILLFDKSGKFIRQIGSMGQGPGEYTAIVDVAADFRNKQIFALSTNGKLICYDFSGNVIKEASSGYHPGLSAKYLNHIDNQLLYLKEAIVTMDKEKKNQTLLYTIDPNLLRSDSLEVRVVAYNGIWFSNYNDFINHDGENTYLYYCDISTNPFVLDTLYQLKEGRLFPYLNLSFKNNGLNSAGDKNIYLLNIYKSARYVFAIYALPKSGDERRDPEHFFCYDTKTRKAYNAKEGYTDDIHTEEIVKIRPLPSDANKFYYLHTHIDDDTEEEPNPTLYIGTLKK